MGMGPVCKGESIRLDSASYKLAPWIATSCASLNLRHIWITSVYINLFHHILKHYINYSIKPSLKRFMKQALVILFLFTTNLVSGQVISPDNRIVVLGQASIEVPWVWIKYMKTTESLKQIYIVYLKSWKSLRKISHILCFLSVSNTIMIRRRLFLWVNSM